MTWNIACAQIAQNMFLPNVIGQRGASGGGEKSVIVWLRVSATDRLGVGARIHA